MKYIIGVIVFLCTKAFASQDCVDVNPRNTYYTIKDSTVVFETKPGLYAEVKLQPYLAKGSKVKLLKDKICKDSFGVAISGDKLYSSTRIRTFR